jgi:hypothetical protein
MATRRTNRGQTIDFDALFNANKNVPAVGNMKVNANGDIIDSKGKVVKKKEDRVREYYRDNPKSSTAGVSLKGEQPKLKADPVPQKSTVTKQQVDAKRAQMEQEISTPEPTAPEGENFDDAVVDQEPIGYKEVHLPSGDIEMVPIYREGE